MGGKAVRRYGGKFRLLACAPMHYALVAYPLTRLPAYPLTRCSPLPPLRFPQASVTRYRG